MAQQFYQAGGTLPPDSRSYIKRKADERLYNYLKEGKYCYVLNARQVGKSSLRVQTSNRLLEEGYSCINIDLTSFGAQDIETVDNWYFTFVYQIIRQLNLEIDEFIDWWELNDKLTVINRFAMIFDKLILDATTQNIVIFIDEIDSILGVKNNFSTDDFFAVIRTFFNLRSEDKRYNRVSFVLFGVATPEDLMADSSRTPFNIAHSILIKQFELKESYVLIEGLGEQKVEKNRILERIFDWTEGTPYLTQKILDYILHHPVNSLDDVDIAIDRLYIQENFKDSNISNIQTRIVNDEKQNIKMLYLVGKLIKNIPIKADDSSLEQIYLKLSGLVKEESGELKYSNKIYREIFNQTWLDETMSKIDRPFAKDLQRWIELKMTDLALLKGEVLDKAEEWAKQRDDLTPDEYEYLRLSGQKEREERLSEEKKRGQSRTIKLLSGSLIIVLAILVGLVNFYLEKEKYRTQSSKFQQQVINSSKSISKNIDLLLNRMKSEIEEKNAIYSEYRIPQSIDENITISDKLIQKFNLQNRELIKNNSALIQLIIYSQKMNFNKQLWFNNLSSMSNLQKYELFDILGFDAYLSRAKRYRDKGEYTKSIDYYQKAFHINSKNASICQALIDIYQKRGENDKVIEWYQKLIAINPKKADYYKMANLYFKEKKFDKAIEYYQKVREQDINNTEALDAIEDIYVKQKEYDKAIEYCQSELKEESVDNYLLTGRIARIYRKYKKEYDRAREYYEKAIEINPNKFWAFDGLAFLYTDKKKYDKAIEFYKNGAEKYPKQAYLFTNGVGWVYRKFKKDINTSIKYYKKAIDLNSTNTIAYNRLGYIFINERKDYDKALKYYYITLSIDKNNTRAYDNIGYINLKTKKYEKAIENFNKSLGINPNNIYAIKTLGYVYRDKYEYEKSIEYFQKAIELGSVDSNVYNNLGYIYRNLGYIDRAIEYYQKAIEIDANNSYAYDRLGDIYFYGRGENDVALKYYKKSIEINPRNSFVYSSFGNIYYRKYQDKYYKYNYNDENISKKIIKYAEKAIALDENNSHAYRLLGNIFRDKKEKIKAQKYYEQAMKLNPKDIIMVYQDIGQLFSYEKIIDFYKKRIEQYPKEAYNLTNRLGELHGGNISRLYYQKAIDINPNKSKAYINMGDGYKKEDINKSIEYYTKAIEVDKKAYSAYESIGRIYEEKEEFDKAMEYYQKVHKLSGGSYGNHHIKSIRKKTNKLREYYDTNIKKFPENAYSFNLEMGDSYKSNDKNESIKYYQKAINVNPSKSQAYKKLAEVYERNKDYNKSIEYFEKVIEINPSKSQVYEKLAEIYERNQDYNKSIEYFEKVIEINPNNNEICSALVKMCSKNKKYKKAEKYYNKAIELNPKEAYNLTKQIAWIYKKNKNYEELEKYYNKIIELNPKEAYILTEQMALIYKEKGNYNKAFEYYEKAIEINPQKIYDLTKDTRHKKNKVFEFYQKRIKLYQKTIKLNPQETYNLTIKIAWTYRFIKNYKKAEEYYNKAIELNPKKAYDLTTQILWMYNKNYKKAEKYYHKAIKLNPKKSYNLTQQIARMYSKNKNYKKAEEFYIKAIKINLKNTDNLTYEMAKMYKNEFRNDKKAIEYYQKSIRGNFNIYDSTYTIALIYNNLKNYNKAEKYYKKAIKINSKKYEPYYQLGDLYMNSEQYDKALNYYLQVLKLYPKIKDTFIYYHLGTIYYYEKGEKDKALESFQKDITYIPETPNENQPK